eukprot:416554_1
MFSKCKHNTLAKQCRFIHQQSLANPGHILTHSNQMLPSIGIGTWGADHFSPEQIANAVKIAITECNYKHIDCASIYQNQHEIGQVLKDCFDSNTIARDALHITSKIWNNEHEPVKLFSSIENTLKDLNIDYLDLCLIHWPFRNDHIIGAHGDERDSNAMGFDINQYMETWEAMNALVHNGLVKNIGVSNMTITKLENMKNIIDLEDSNVKLLYPVVNQVEMHPYFQQKRLLKYCQDNNIIITAALPLGSPERPERDRSDDDPVVMNNNVLTEISKEINCSIAQVIIGWHINRGVVCVPKATEKWMLDQNMYAANIKLSNEQMKRIECIDQNHRLTKGQVFCWYKEQPWQELWDNE